MTARPDPRPAPAARHLEELELLEAALDQAAGPFTLADPDDMAFLYVNQAAARLWGLSREDALRLGPLGVADRSPAARPLRDLYADLVANAPEPAVDTGRIMRRDGTEVLCESHCRVIRAKGRVLVACNMRDITGQHAEQLQQLEILQAAVDDAGEAVVVVDVPRQRYAYVNNTAARLFHLSREELLRLGPRDSLIWEDGLADPTARLQEVLRRMIESHPHPTTEETQVTRRDGTTFRAEFLRRAILLGGRWIMISLVRDVSERRATQTRLELFKRALDDADEAIYLVDPQRLVFVDVNERACRMDGVDRGELMRIGPVGWDFNEADLRARCAEAIAAYPNSVVEEVHRKQAGGKLLIIEKVRRAIRPEGEWLVIVHVRDISERKAAEQRLKRHVEELARSNEDLERFGYVTSHDLSEPLRMMASYAQLLNRRYGDTLDNDAREFMGFIIDGAKRMKLLIDALLTYSRAGRSVAPKGPVGLDRALDDALANLAHAIRDAGASIERDPLPSLEAEPIAMMQLFQNLVANALKFRSPDAPVIRIQAADMGEDWHFSVSDNGIGIAPEHFERIFVVFQRLHERSRYEGTGIGLSICKKIVDRHGGRIWVESQPGVGTTFRFALPKKQAALAFAAPGD